MTNLISQEAPKRFEDRKLERWQDMNKIQDASGHLADAEQDGKGTTSSSRKGENVQKVYKIS